MLYLSFRKRQILMLSINVFIAVSTLLIAYMGIRFGATSAQPGEQIIGFGYFKPFTMDSNILAGIAAAILAFSSARSLKNNADTMPSWFPVFYFMISVCLALTLIISVFFLAPVQVMKGKSYFSMFEKELFFFHFLNPLLAIFTFTQLLNQHPFCKRDCFIGAIPMFLYSIVYFMMVVVWKKWSDFYSFTFGGKYELIPLVLLVVYSLTLLIARVLLFRHNRICKE